MANPRAFVREIQRRVDSAAVQLLRRTRFVPGERHGVPVPSLTTQPLRNVFPKE